MRHIKQSSPPRVAAARFSALLVVVGVFTLAGCLVFADWWVAYPEGTTATYVGRDSCIECHQAQAQLWTGSDHDLAMDHATDASVLGDFNAAQITHHGITSTMFRRDGKFFVNTEGADGQLADFQVKYVLGVRPLQQYMVEFDRRADQPANEIARLQVLRLSWDTEKRNWFYLSPPDVTEKLDPTDPLHWTRAAQNWNHMCASCHSTDLQKNYDVATKTYHTTYSEIDVSCEACHGPGSTHVELATSNSLFWDRNLGYGLKQLKSKDTHVEIQACAPCHSRRHALYPDDPPGQDYYDCFGNELLTPLTYYADGQILDEVYVYGSFIQSKMYHKDVRCSDCHNPHSTKLKFEGNAMCNSCHAAHDPAKYDTPAHHRHNAGSEGARCVNCHMPESPFMDVDFRRDHSIRVPRPDLSVDLGTPNACTGCHLELNRIDPAQHGSLPHYAAWMSVARGGNAEVQAEITRVDRWAADLYEQWYPGKYGKQDHFAYALSKGWQGDTTAADDLHELARSRQTPAILRATALVTLNALSPERSWPLSADLLDEKDPQVRVAAVTNLEAMNPRERLRALTPMLHDSVRMVRIEAARVLADEQPQAFNVTDRQARERALSEYRLGLAQHGDLAMSHVGLAILAERQRDFATAEKAYRTAISVQPDVTGPRTNLAALLEQIGQQTGQDVTDEVAALRTQELPLIRRDATLAPESGPIQYRYGLALYLNGNLDEARVAMQRACELDPNSEQYRVAQTLLLEKAGDKSAAIESVQLLRRIAPNNPGYGQLEQRIRGQ
jgi:tetratricopeptide (TPR) repeat protein